MKHARLLLSSVALIAGLSILGLSLTTAVTSAQSSTGSFEASNRRFYVGQEILPDHIAYPALMALDRAKLEAASPSERIYIQIEYGQRRLEYAQQLVENKNIPLAISTATKAKKYYISAAQETLDNDFPDLVKKHLLKVMLYQEKEFAELNTKFPETDRGSLEKLTQQSSILIERLTSELASAT